MLAQPFKDGGGGLMINSIQPFVHGIHVTSYISSRLSSNSEAFASELLDNIPLYYMHSDMLTMLKSST